MWPLDGQTKEVVSESIPELIHYHKVNDEIFLNGENKGATQLTSLPDRVANLPKKVLKPTGSLYFYSDPTTSQCFRNEII